MSVFFIVERNEVRGIAVVVELFSRTSPSRHFALPRWTPHRVRGDVLVIPRLDAVSRNTGK